MDEPIKQALSVLGAVISNYLVGRLQPKSKLVYWIQHYHLFDVQPPSSPEFPSPQPFKLHTHTMTIQNAGRAPAEEIEIVHKQKPDLFMLYPSLNFIPSVLPSGEYLITIKSLAPNEFVNIEYLGFINEPVLLYIRSKNSGHARPINARPQQVYPYWTQLLGKFVLFVGAATIIYWLITFIAKYLAGLTLIQ